MKKYGVALSALLVCGAVFAAQQTDLSNREVRDPRQLEAILDANFADAESRLAAAEAGTSLGLASNKVFIGSALGKAYARTLSGLFSITTNGVASATSSGTAWTNGTASGTLTPVVLTNATVGGAALSGVGMVVTNATVGGAALSGVSTVLTNASITPALIVTNVTFTSQIITNVYDLQTNSYTIYTGAALQTATLTLTVESGTPVVSAPSITLATGTPAVSSPSISLQTVASGAVAVTITPATGSFVKP